MSRRPSPIGRSRQPGFKVDRNGTRWVYDIGLDDYIEVEPPEDERLTSGAEQQTQTPPVRSRRYYPTPSR